MTKAIPNLEWTGERYLPWVRNATLAYEHLHRYAFAARFAKNKRVLDLGSGEGYGANILAQTATSVLGVDIDDEAIQHAAAKYRRENLKFDTGSFEKLPIGRNNTFDLVVCFEAIEHVQNHDELLSEVKRLLRPNGLFMVSTPNKTAYRKESDEDNPYHVNELEPEEFKELLSRYFRESKFLGQRIHPVSTIWPLGQSSPNPIEELTVERGITEFEFIPNDKRVPIYIVALASDSPEALVPAGSVLIDSSNELLLEMRKSSEAIARIQEDLGWHLQRLDDAQHTVAKLTSDLQVTQTRLNNADSQFEAIFSSNSWKLLTSIWNVRDGLLPLGSIRRRVVQKFLTLIVPGSK